MAAQHPAEKSIFLAAIDKTSAAERAAFLDQACGANRPLRAEVEALLRAHEKSQVLLDAPEAAGPTVERPPCAEQPGTVIGPYKLLQQIGEGGMGTVFLAEQTHPVQRKVALKLIKAGMDSRQVIARFEAERQALALMDHPHIAKVLDAGTTDSGRPYFVMELVKGMPITRYCDEHHLTPRERLELFVPVCQAVQHAHQKGIIHRDLKPSNVLVCLYDGKPVPKVIDFGVAKATGQKLTEHTLFTEFGQVVGTLEYMSPEQAELNQLDIDTRSDIYALGVLLYELLTGTTPLERKRFQAVAFLEVLRLIREEESQRPSTRLSTTEGLPTIAANRGLEPKKLSGLVRGELDWIVMKTLDKDRNRRYETANGLALDVQRYLNDETVQACPPSALYRFRKFARRNKAALVGATGVIVALAVLAGGTGWVLRDQAARQVAVEEKVIAALEEATQSQQQANWPEALSAAKRAEALWTSGQGNAELRARVRAVRSDVEMAARLEGIRVPATEVKEGAEQAYVQAFREYGIDVMALNPEEVARRIRARSIPAELAGGLEYWALLVQQRNIGDRNRWKHLLALARAADPDPWRDRVREALTRDDRKSLVELAATEQIADLPAATFLVFANALARTGAKKEGTALLRKAQQRYPGHVWINFQLAYYLLQYAQPPQYDDAIRFYSVALALRPQSADNHSHLAFALMKKGTKEAVDDALIVIRQALRLQPDFADAHHILGGILRKKGALDESIAAYRAAIRIQPDFFVAHNSLGGTLAQKGLLNEALAACQEALRLKPDFAEAHLIIGDILAKQGMLDEAVVAYTEAIRLKPAYADAHNNRAITRERQGDKDAAIAGFREAIHVQPDFARAHNNLGVALAEKGLLDEAVAACREAVRVKPAYATAHESLGWVLRKKGMKDEAIAAYREAIRLKPDAASIHLNLGNALAFKGLKDEAIAAYQEAIRLKPDFAGTYVNLGDSLRGKGLLDEAVVACREAIRLQPDLVEAHVSLGTTLARKGVLHEAAAAYQEAIRLKPNYVAAHVLLGAALDKQGKYVEAAAAYREAIRLRPEVAGIHNNLAWLLATCPEPKWRDPRRAVELAKRAVQLAPKEGAYWNTLGVAYYRHEDGQAAVEALNRSIDLRRGGDAGDWFFLAMAHWKLDQKDQARRWYDKADRWMATHHHPDWPPLRAEAKELLRIEEKKN